MSQTHAYTNRLIGETSPYLLQHAHNPVDWYPWGEEALTRAKTEDKPILLSIGYSACHWCHVMEHESFENEEIAAIMNRHFVCIKVDREERPDLDTIYMQALQLITQQGGWPMTMFLLPDARPFFGGTYFPPRDRQYGSQMMAGFPRILQQVAEIFATQRETIEEQAETLSQYLQQGSAPPEVVEASLQPSLTLFDAISERLAKDFDPFDGGFKGGSETGPKFPQSMSLELLLRIHLHRLRAEMSLETQEKASELEIVNLSLEKMAAGGIYDHLGGGFHRYSVDEKWLVPHFEKMLYDNALLSQLYLHAYLVTREPLYAQIVEEVLAYVVREMTSPEGGFYSTQDADSEGVEGKFFVWSWAEIDRHLEPEDARLFKLYYGVTEGGNFEHRQNILHRWRPSVDIASKAGVSVEVLEESVKRAREKLFSIREQRIKPGRDEKVLTSWNGLMLKSFAEAARYLGRTDYLEVAEQNASFLLRTMHADGQLLHTYKDGRATLKGYLEDYACLADGLLALYEASGKEKWFQEARILIDQAIKRFRDQDGVGFFDTASDHEALFMRPKDMMDNAVPAGNSVMVDVLLRLSAWTGESEYRELAESYLNYLRERMSKYPQAFGHLLAALDISLSSFKEIALVGEQGREQLLNVIHRTYRPASVLAWSKEEEEGVPLLKDRTKVEEKATVYVCEHFVCQQPVTTAEALEALLG